MESHRKPCFNLSSGALFSICFRGDPFPIDPDAPIEEYQLTVRAVFVGCCLGCVGEPARHSTLLIITDAIPSISWRIVS